LASLGPRDRPDGPFNSQFANVVNGKRLFSADGPGWFIVNYGPEVPSTLRTLCFPNSCPPR
jgi:hypothetical protein